MSIRGTRDLSGHSTQTLMKALADPIYAATVELRAIDAMSELQNRKAAMAKKQMSQAQAPTTNVKNAMLAELAGQQATNQMAQNVAQGMPQAAPQMPQQMPPQAMPQETGVASLPVRDDMFTAAEGGIVAFADGGEVPGYAIGGVPKLELNPYDVSYLQQEMERNPFKTLEEIEAREDKRRESRGIRNIFEDQMAEAKEREAGLTTRKNEILGLGGLRAAGALMSNPSQFFGPGLGAASTAFAESVTPELRAFEASKDALRRERGEIQRAEMGMKESQFRGDTEAFNKYDSERRGAIKDYNAGLKENKALENKALETEYGYGKDLRIAGINAAAANRPTDLDKTTKIYFESLVGQGADPKNPETMAVARRKAYEDVGLAGAKVDLNALTAATDKAGKISSAVNADPEVKAIAGNLEIEYLKPNADPIKIKALETKLETAKRNVQRRFDAEEKPAASKDTVKPADVAPKNTTNFVEDGFSFPSKKALDDYRKAKKAQKEKT